jgi:TonB family protein
MRQIVATALFAAVILIVSVSVARAQDATGDAGMMDAAAIAPGDALTPPVLRARIEATYPPQAMRDLVEGVVGLEIAVDQRGNVEAARVTGPAGHGFDEAALDAVRKFTFEPARKNGTAIRSTVQLAYEFHLPTPAPASAAQSTAVPPLAAVAPIPMQEG